jgi:hypothetical protein
VLTVSVEDSGLVSKPVIITEGGTKAQVGMEMAPDPPVTVQVRATVPVNPPPGVK